MGVVFPRLYAIMDSPLIETWGMACAQMMVDSGVKLVQIRYKVATSQRLFHLAIRISGIFNRNAVRLIVNDRPDVAMLTDAGGVHVGQTDVPVEVARQVCGNDRWIGVSTHSLRQVQRAAAASTDYVALGPIFPTSTKENPEPVAGIDFIRAARRLTSKPLVAIGGITLDRVAAVLAAGADSVAVARDLFSASNVKRRIQEYVEAVEN